MSPRRSVKAGPPVASHFSPQSAGRIEKAAPSVALGRRDLTMVAIDYSRMGQPSEGAQKVAVAPKVQVQAIKQPDPVVIASAAGDPADGPGRYWQNPEQEMTNEARAGAERRTAVPHAQGCQNQFASA